MKFISWNINSLKVRWQQLLDLLERHEPDVVGLQETKMQNQHFPQQALEALGYYVIYSGQKTYNGVALLSKIAGEAPRYDLSDEGDEQKRFIAWTVNDIRIVNVYIPNGSAVGSDKFQYKLQWLQDLKTYLYYELQTYSRVLVMGDFNIAPDDRDVHDPDKWRGKVLFSEPEHNALQDLFNLGLTDAFRLDTDEAGHFSWWDYRQAAFRRNLGLRIDLMLTSSQLSSQLDSMAIDIDTRKQERPSDHAPVIMVI